MQYIHEQRASHQAAGQPVISVDAKKKELVGQFRNGGREWRPKGQPEEVEAYDFAKKDLGKAIPYGIYDQTTDTGWVSACMSTTQYRQLWVSCNLTKLTIAPR